MPTLCYVGNFAVPWTTENDVRRAFEACGWDVDPLQEAEFVDAIATGRQHKVAGRMMKADMVMHTLTQGSLPRGDRVLPIWQQCAARGIPTASIHLDLFYGLDSRKHTGPRRSELPRTHPMFKVAYVFTADGGHDDQWKADGVNHHWLPPAVNHIEAVDVPPIPELVGRYDVGFIGSDKYHAEWAHRPALVQWLRDTYGDRFLHAAGGSTRRTIRGMELNRVLASVPVWVGDSCLTRPDFPYWSDRVPETWGRGGFLIHPHVDALDEHYGEHHPGWSWEAWDWRGLGIVIDCAIDPVNRGATEARRRDFAAFTREHDTYVQRVRTILDTIGL